uniref:Uncharacterized protein n=1 Tax=Plectus sambesii TaxID=2011161 RepID=A0A914VZS3_9BILA
MAKVGRKDIIDLEGIVLAWAKEMFRFTKTKEQGRIEKECLEFHVNWKYVIFEFESPSYSIVPVALQGGQGPKQNMQPQVLFRTGSDFGQMSFMLLNVWGESSGNDPTLISFLRVRCVVFAHWRVFVGSRRRHLN